MPAVQNQNEVFSRAIGLAVTLTREHWKDFVLFSLLNVAVLTGLKIGLAAFDILDLGLMFLGPEVLVNTFFLSAFIHLMLWSYRPDLAEARSIAARAYLTVLIVNVVYHAAVSVGLLFLLIPGLIALAVFLQAPVIVLAQRPPLGEALTKSVQSGWPMVFPIVGLVILSAFTLIPVLIAATLVTGIVSAISDTLGAAIMEAIFGAWLTLLQAILATSVFLSLHNGGQKLDWSGGADVVDGPGRLH